MRIYISSTTQDLTNHRRVVIEALRRAGHTPVCMEDHAAGDVVPKDECLRDVATCDVYVGIFGWRYGFIPPQCDISITEMEYREAIICRIPTLVFLTNEKEKWPSEFYENGVSGQLIGKLREELQHDKWVRFFSNPDNLAMEVLTSITPLIMPLQFEKAQESTPKDDEILKKALDFLQKDRAESERKRRRRERDRIPNPVPEKLIQHFQDREAELFKLRQCMSKKDLRIVSICGRGGVGKTSLAAKLSRELKESFREDFSSSMESFECIVYVPLDDASYRTPDRIVELISRTLDYEASTELKEFWEQGSAPLRERLVELFRGPLKRYRCLILLDNLESVMDENNRILHEYMALTQFIEAFLEYDHSSLLIITCRRMLSLSHDTEIATKDKRVQISLDEGLPESFAIALLRQLDCDGKLGIRNATDEILGNIVRRCQCIPRTLETLVGTLMQRPTWTLDTLLANESLLTRMLENPMRELYMSLSSDQDRLVMQTLAMYGKPVPSAAIRYILPALQIEEILDKLVRNFVVNHDRGQFWLHPFDRQYAYSQIPEQGSNYSKQALHKLAAQFYQSIPCPPRGSRVSLDDISPILNAIEHLLSADQAEDAVALFLDNALHEDLHWWGYYILLSDLCHMFLNHSISPKKKIALHILLGKIDRNLGKLDEARKIYENVLPFIDDAKDPESEIGLLISLGDISYYLNDLDRALEYHHRAEELLTTTRIPILQSENTGDMANVMLSKGKYEEAQYLYEQAITFTREAGSKTGKIHEGIWNGGLANVHSNLFFNTSNAMHRESAISYFHRAIAIAEETADRRHESHWNGVLGNFYQKLGDYESAKAHLKKALSISEKIHYGRVIPTQVQWLTITFREHAIQCVQKQDFESALQICRSFLKVADEIGNAEIMSEAERLLEELILTKVDSLFQEGRMEDAIAEGRNFIMSNSGKFELYETLGSICMQRGRQTGRKDIFQLSIDAYTKVITACPDESRHYFYLQRANAYALMGKIEEAISDYSEVIKRKPQNTGAAFSLAEVLIWAGQYSKARFSLEALQPYLINTTEKMICAWLMCHILNLEGTDFSAYQKILEDEPKENIKLNYDVKDIEIYLQQLDPEKFNKTQIQNAWMIQSLIIKFAGHVS